MSKIFYVHFQNSITDTESFPSSNLMKIPSVPQSSRTQTNRQALLLLWSMYTPSPPYGNAIAGRTWVSWSACQMFEKRFPIVTSSVLRHSGSLDGNITSLNRHRTDRLTRFHMLIHQNQCWTWLVLYLWKQGFFQTFFYMEKCSLYSFRDHYIKCFWTTLLFSV